MMVVAADSAPIRHKKRPVIIRAATTVRALTLEEPGGTTHRLAFTLADPDHLILIEEWSDGEALAAHLATAHFAEFAKRLRSALQDHQASPGTTSHRRRRCSPGYLEACGHRIDSSAEARVSRSAPSSEWHGATIRRRPLQVED
jgi:quinol monooxygenase YgiN